MNMEIQAALDVADETDSFLQITDVIYDKESEMGYDSLTEAEKTVYCIDQLLSEMENSLICSKIAKYLPMKMSALICLIKSKASMLTKSQSSTTASTIPAKISLN